MHTRANGEPVSPTAILLVDDYPANLLAVESSLVGLGLEICRATSGEEALRYALDRDFALILLDVQMPGMDGFEVAGHLRSLERTRHLPILFLTAIDTTPERMMRGYQMGAVDFLQKPFHPDVLRAKVSVFAEMDRRAKMLREAERREQDLRNDAEIRRRSDAILRESEERFRVLAETAADAIVTMDEDSIVVYANPAVERVFGFRPDELVGRTIAAVMPPGAWERHAAGVARYLATGERRVPWQGLELAARRKNGEEVALEINFAEFMERGRHYFTATMRDITERRRAEDERARLFEEAQAASMAKNEFLANMSHELRTPLNAILGYSELMGLEIQGAVTEAQAGSLERIKASGQHLLGLIDDVLDLAKVEAGRIEVARELGDAATAIGEALPLVLPQASLKGVHVENGSEPGGAFPYVGDPDRVRQVLVNLLDNAVKFTEPGGRVTVRAEVRDQAGPGGAVSSSGPWTCVEVTDTGIGIAEDQLDAVFRPFVQAESGHTRKYGGTGLGLTISREFARLMEGDLTVCSTAGKGSTFTLWLARPGGASAMRGGEGTP